MISTQLNAKYQKLSVGSSAGYHSLGLVLAMALALKLGLIEPDLNIPLIDFPRNGYLLLDLGLLAFAIGQLQPAPLALQHQVKHLFDQLEVIRFLVPAQGLRDGVDLNHNLELRRDDVDHFLEKFAGFPSQELSLCDPLQLEPLHRKEPAFGNEIS